MLLVYGQDKDKDNPIAINVPAGSRLIQHTYAKGVQVYVCTMDPKDSSRFTWSFKEPRAGLYADKGYHKLIGKHYFDEGKNPTWELNDGSRISGVKVQQASAPDTTAIPWLLLKATRSGGSGSLKQVQFIQRIRTNGGKAPAIAKRQKKGQILEVPYAAEYLFYNDK
jgi:hypothetical protein